MQLVVKESYAQRTFELTELVKVRVARHKEKLVVVFFLRREWESRRDV